MISGYIDRGMGSLVLGPPCPAFVTCSTKSRQVTKVGCYRPGNEARGGVYPSRDDPGMVTVSRESQDSLTGGRGMCVCVCMYHPWIVTVSMESWDTLTGG